MASKGPWCTWKPSGLAVLTWGLKQPNSQTRVVVNPPWPRGSGQESRGSTAPHDLQHPRMHTWAFLDHHPDYLHVFCDLACFRCQDCPAHSPSSALLCVSCATLGLQVLSLGLQRTGSLTPAGREMLRHAWSLGLLPLQLVRGPGFHGNTRAWVPRILTQGFPGDSTSLNSTWRWGSFFPKTGTSLRVKSCWQTHLCIWSCCGKTGRTLQHMPAAKGWWRKGLEGRGRVITWRSTKDSKGSKSLEQMAKSQRTH